MTLALVLALVMPVGITVSMPTPVAAHADNVTITSPATTAYAGVNKPLPVSFTVGISGDTTPTNFFYATIYLKQGGTVKYQTSSMPYQADNTTFNPQTYSWLMTGVANGTYDLQVGAEHPTTAGTPTYSALLTSAVIINSTHVPATPTLLSPASASCSATNIPTFSWTAVTQTSYTFTYNFQLSADLSFSAPENNTTGLATPQITIGSALNEGTHYWRVRAQDQYGNTSAWTTARSICIDISPPTQPAGLTSLSPTGGYNPTYTWTASTDNSACANIQYIVTTYNGASALVDNVTVSTPSYTRSTLFGGGDHTWYVLPFDCAGNFGTIAGPGRFTMPTVTTTYSIPLSAGWNLISLPLIPANTAIGTVLSSTNIPGNKVVSVWYLDYGTSCSSPTFKWYKPANSASTLATMEAGKAYWISCNQTGTLSGINARPCPAVAAGAPPAILQYQLCYNAVQDGWNMLGFKCTQSMLASEYLAGVAYSSLYRYAGGWAPVDASSDNLTPGTGYYIRMTGSGKITPPCY